VHNQLYATVTGFIRFEKGGATDARSRVDS
jgi:hypothetical protein